MAMVIRLVTRSGGHDRSGPHEGRPVFSKRVLAIAGMHLPSPSAISEASVTWSGHTPVLRAATCCSQKQQLKLRTLLTLEKVSNAESLLQNPSQLLEKRKENIVEREEK